MRTPALNDVTLNEMESFHAYNYLQIMYHQVSIREYIIDSPYIRILRVAGD